MAGSKIQLPFYFWDEPSLPKDGVCQLPPDLVIISWNHDAVYSFNLKNYQMKRIFNPGGEEFTMLPGNDGILGIYAFGTNHFWFLRPD